ncbi:hypothetical protein M422DRAFT_774186 [Sphaerobolus stellatus SS14]|nr:hypothetical protein M422DRAFT_774186 [Sphaerobolus stellatus SS14]
MGQSVSGRTSPEGNKITYPYPLSSAKKIKGWRRQEVAAAIGNKCLVQELAAALERGTRRNLRRPGLPIELVTYIIRLAECTIVNRRLTAWVKTPCLARADSARAVQKLWFETVTLTASEISKISGIQLHTIGWTKHPNGPSCTWFEIVILTQQQEDHDFVVKRRSDNTEFTWISHHNHVLSDGVEYRRGMMFTYLDEFFIHGLQEGDKIGVRVCAQYEGWQNFAVEGVLRVDEWFEPRSINYDS